MITLLGLLLKHYQWAVVDPCQFMKGARFKTSRGSSVVIDPSEHGCVPASTLYVMFILDNAAQTRPRRLARGGTGLPVNTSTARQGSLKERNGFYSKMHL